VRLFTVPFWPVYFSGFVLIIASIFTIKRKIVFFIPLLLIFFILGVLHLKNSYTISKSCVSRYLYYGDDTIYIARGFVNNNPVIKNNRATFIFRVKELQFDQARYESCGEILVYAKNTDSISYGEELILLGRISKPYRVFQGKISGVMHLKSNRALYRLNKNRGSLIRRLAYNFRNRIEEIFLNRLSPLAAGISSAMVLGDKGRVSPVVYDSMVKSGTVHILVVSGFNVGIIAFIFGLFFKILRIPRKPRYILVVVCLIIYCFMTGASTPVVRATVMGVFLTLGYLFRREPDITNSIVLAVFFISIVEPKALFSISFQLSFISVAAIVYLYPKLRSILRIDKIKIRFFKAILEGVLVSFSAWLGTMGLIAYNFKIFSPVTLFSNIIIVPLATLITLTGLSMVIVSLALPPLAGPLVSANEVLVVILLKVNALFLKLPFAYLYL
jgi:competence protein ComEC